MRKTKYFIASDIHSFYRPFKQALTEAGWNKNSKSHRLVILGDIFDRGRDTVKVYDFIRSVPKERRILVKGNHEELFLSLLDKRIPEEHDYSNGTVDSFLQIAKREREYLNRPLLIYDFLNTDVQWLSGEKRNERFRFASKLADAELAKRFEAVKKEVIASGIPAWLKSDEWVDYFELGDCVMVHSFIPLKDCCEYFPNWRTDASELEWSYARWGCPYRLFDSGLFKEPGKTLVCGHWHAIDFRRHYKELNGRYDIEELAFYPESLPLFGTFKHTNEQGQSIIKLDACKVISDCVNVFVLEM